MINYTLSQGEQMLGDMLFESEEKALEFMQKLESGVRFIGKLVQEPYTGQSRRGSLWVKFYNGDQEIDYQLVKQ